MSIFTNEGKISDIYVNHNGFKKPVVSGWVNHNGVPILFYKKGGSSLYTEELTVAWSKYSAGTVKQSSTFDVTKAKKIVVEGTISSAKTSANAAYSNLYIKLYGTKTVDLWGNTVSSSTAYKDTVKKEYDVSDWNGDCYVYVYNESYTKYIGCDLTITLL